METMSEVINGRRAAAYPRQMRINSQRLNWPPTINGKAPVGTWINGLTRPATPAGCVFDAPLWHPRLGGTAFKTVDKGAFTGTVTGALWTPTGRRFDPIDDKINFGNTGLAVVGIEFWWNPLVQITTASAASAIMRVTAAAGGGYGIVAGASTGNIENETLTILETSGGGNTRTGVVNYTFNARFYHIVWLWNVAQNKYDAYIDGAVQNTVPAINGHVAQMTASDLQLGLREPSGSGYTAKVLGNLRIYSSLTAAQVKANYESSKWRWQQ